MVVSRSNTGGGGGIWCLVNLAVVNLAEASNNESDMGHAKHKIGAQKPEAPGFAVGNLGAKVKCPISHTTFTGPPNPLCDILSSCCSFTGPWTVTCSSLRMLRRVAAFCRPLRPVLLLVSFPRVAWCAVCASVAPNSWHIEDVLVVAGENGGKWRKTGGKG